MQKEAAPFNIFIAADVTERATAFDLQKTLAACAPELPLQFWNGSQYTSTEYRAEVKNYIEKARLFLLILSPDLENHPDTRFEMETALAEQARRPETFHIVIAQARRAVIKAPWQGFLCLPGREEEIDGLHADRQVIRTAYQIAEFIRGIKGARPAGMDGLEIPLTLPDLQERLHEMCMRHNLTDVLHLLKDVVHQEQLSRTILQIEDDYIATHLRNHTNLTDFQYGISAIKKRIAEVIDSLNDDFLLFRNWRILFLERYRKSAGHQTTAFYFPLDDVKVPERLNISDAVSVNLTIEQQQEFRRLLLLAQDAIPVEKYAAAHHYCDQARTKIDPQSAQLYEYLLITFIKKEGPQTIMRRLMDDILSGFNYVKLYSDRYYQYQHANPPVCPSETGVYNLNVAVEELAAALHAVYSSIDGDAVCRTGELERTDGKRIVEKSLDALLKLYHSLSETHLFVDTMIIELVGGGKFSWIDRIVVKDDDISFISNSSFDLKGKVDELLAMLEQADTHRVPPKQREMIREDLFWGLLSHCQSLAAQIREEKRLFHEQTDVRRSVIRLVQACVAGHYLLTRPGDVLEAEKSLLRLAIELLMPQLIKDGGRYDLPEEILLDWFTLDPYGRLVHTVVEHKYSDFPASAILKKIIRDHAGQHNWDLISENIRREVWLKYGRETEAIYEHVRYGLQWTDFRKMDEFGARKLLVDYLNRCWICYLAYPDDPIRYQDKIVQELVGNGLLQWFTINPKAVNTHPDSLYFQYDAKMKLYDAFGRTNLSEDAVTAMLIGNLYNKVLVPAYQQLDPLLKGTRRKCADLLGGMLMAFKNHAVPAYLDMVYQELTEETKFKWVEVDLRGHWFNAVDSFDAVGILEHFAEMLPLRYPMEDTIRRIADRRLEEQKRRYEMEISVIRHENRLPERKIVADIIHRLKGVFQFCPDLRYLQIPFEELNDKGRIRWYQRRFGIFKSNENHHENHHIYFDLRAERIELKLFMEKAMSGSYRI